MQHSNLISVTKARTSYVFVLAALALLIIFVALFVLQVEKNPLRLDEVDYFRSMQNVVNLGVPLYYSGEANIDKNLLIPLSIRRLDNQDFTFYRFKPETGKLKETFIAIVDPESRYTYGMWHPPLYIYLGSFFFRLFPLTPDNSSWLRYFNLVFSIGLFGGMAMLARELNRNRWRLIFLVALVLFVSSNLAVRGSILIDYNGTLGPCVAVWTVVAYLRSERQRRLHWGLVVVMVLVWFTSLGIGVSLVLSLLVYWLFWGRRQMATWYPLAAVLLGTALFFPIFLVFCRTLNLPFTQPFLHNISRAGVKWDMNHVIQMFNEMLKYVDIYSRAIGIAAVCVAILFFVKAVLTRTYSSSPARALLPVIFIVGMLSQASLGADAWGFMKYLLFLLPLLFTYIACEVLNLAESARLPWKMLAVVGLLVVVLADGVDQIQSLQAPGGTLYNPGQQGITEIAYQLKTLSDPAQVVLGEKDIAFYADRKFIEWFGPGFTDANYVRQLIASENISWIAVSVPTFESTSDAIKTYLKNTFAITYQSGDFIILKRNL